MTEREKKAAFEKWYEGHHQYRKSDQGKLGVYWDDENNNYTSEYVDGCFSAFCALSAALDTAPDGKVDEKCPACNGTGHRDGPSYSDPQKMNMYGCQVCKSSGIIRTTKPADAGQLVAFAEWLSGRSPETFWVTAVDESGPSYMNAKEAVAWFLMQQQKGERRE